MGSVARTCQIMAESIGPLPLLSILNVYNVPASTKGVCHADARVCRTPWFDSEVLKGNLPGDPPERMIPVYLPPGYGTSGRSYPVIYVLAGHGSSGVTYLNSPAWGESFPEKMDRLIVSGAMQPVIGVFPDCFTIFGGAQYLNSSALGQYEDYLVEEIIPFVDRTSGRCPTAPIGRSRARVAAATGRWSSRCGIRSCSARSRTIRMTSTSSSACCRTWRSCTPTC